MCVSQLIQGVVGGILALGGIWLAIAGGRSKKRKRKWWLIGLGLSSTAIGLFMLFTSFPQYAAVFSVLATLALAFVAFLTIQEANAREKRRIEEERRHREENINRDFRRRSMDGIIDWASKLTDARFKLPTVVTTEKPWNVIPELEQLATRRAWVDNVARIFGNDFQGTAWQATRDLDAYISTLNKWSSNEAKLGEVSEARRILDESIKDLLEFAFVIKANEKL